MIVICEKCKASFLVPSSLFGAGPRTVRCARCGHTWLQSPESTKPEETVPPPRPKTSEGEGASAEKELSFDEPAEGLPETNATSKETPEEIFVPEIKSPLEEEAEKECKESAVYRAFQTLAFVAWGKIFTWFALLVFLALAIFLPTVYFARNEIVNEWPHTQLYYELLGIDVEYAPAPLLLQRIHSERRYMDGAMHLVVSGDIFNQSPVTQPIPEIKAEAHGPKNAILHSWNIKPSRPEILSDQTIPFFSAVLSPEGNVVEVTLSFVPIKNDSTEQNNP